MKKWKVILLALVLVLSGCGETDMQTETTADGPLTQMAVDAMSDEQIEKLLLGDWAYPPISYYDIEHMYGRVDVTLNEDGTTEWANYPVETTWEVKDGKFIFRSSEFELSSDVVVTDGQITVDGSLMRVDRFNGLLDEMFTFVELTPENVSEYLQIDIVTDAQANAFGNRETNVVIQIKPNADEGIYMECSWDTEVQLVIPEHTVSEVYRGTQQQYVQAEQIESISSDMFGRTGGFFGFLGEKDSTVHEITADQIRFGDVSGKLVYVNSEYVDEVRNEEGERIVVINGEDHYCGMWSFLAG